jgi:hypothetical protein
MTTFASLLNRASKGTGALLVLCALAFTAAPALAAGPQAPAVESVSTPTVTSSGATVQALVNPEGQPTTSCVVEYGETTGYGSRVACETSSIGGSSVQPIVAKLAGLPRDTAYDYRVVVNNATGAGEGAGSFVTNSVLAGPPATGCPNPGHSGLSGRLPDCRAYELLTPPNKSDAEDLFGLATEHIAGTGDASESGYADEAPGEEGDKYFFGSATAFGANAAAGGNDYVFSRAASGWRQTALTAPGAGSQSLLSHPLLNEDFSEVLVEDQLGSDGNPEAQKKAGFFGAPGGPYETLFDLPESTTNSELVGASADFSRLFFQSTEHSYAPAAAEQLPKSKALYEYSGGHYTLVNVEANGKTTSPCGAISTAEPEASGTQANSVSTDGSHVFFLSPNPEDGRCYHEGFELAPSEFTGTPPQLYLRVGGQTIMVSAPETGVVDPDGPQPVAFAGASAGGSRVWFITRGELTKDDQVLGNHEPELYEYDVEKAEGERLTRISGGDSHNAVGSVAWVVPSADGSTVYFTAAGQLAPGAPKLNTIQPGERSPYNLYRYDTATASTTYIATVSGNDWFSSTIGGMKTLNVRLPLNVRSDWQSTPDGGFLLFDSTANITGYNPEDFTGECTQYIDGDKAGEYDGNCAEVYRYDAATNSVLCVSCNPDGASPTTGALFDGNTTSHEVRAISNDGAYVFFNTSESLSALATNEQVNVYEWHEGEISLISSGQDSSPSYFLGTDASGADVFIGTHSQLVPQDTDSAGDLYDARIDGGFPAPRGSAACEGDACQSPPAAPAEQTPASLTFAGAGNLTVSPPAAATPPKPVVKKKAVKCAKGKKLTRGKCVRVKKSNKGRK